MQKRHSWKKEQPQIVLSGTASALISARREVVRRALPAEQEVQTYTDELERLRRELESANQMKDEFLSIASHELRTPITVIRAHAQMIARASSAHFPGTRTRTRASNRQDRTLPNDNETENTT